MQNWLEILRCEIEKKTITDVARRLGYDRSSISLAANGKYPGGTDKIAASVLREFAEQTACPYLAKQISLLDCKKYSNQAMTTSSARGLRFWAACNACPNKTSEKGAIL